MLLRSQRTPVMVAAESQFSDVDDDASSHGTTPEEKKKYLVEHSQLNPVAPSFYPSPIKKKFRNFSGREGEILTGCWERIYQFSDVDVVPHEYGGDQCRDDGEGTVLFNPPVYIQRYSAVVNEISHHPEYKRVVDFGSSSCAVFRYFKTLSSLQEITMVDVDRELLMRNHEIAKPFIGDFISKRTGPLDVYILCGSIAEFDERLNGCDVVTGIEIIEHLDPPILEKVPEIIFNCIRPKMAILTTPNQEFNVVFKNLNGMRHWDHRFEWTREEFSDWCQSVCDSYPSYTFEVKGIGQGSEGTEHLGCCTQMAVFRRKDCSDEAKKSVDSSCPRKSVSGRDGFRQEASTAQDGVKDGQVYEVIAQYSYPVHQETRTQEQILEDDVRYCLNQLVFSTTSHTSGLAVYVRLTDLLDRVKEGKQADVLECIERMFKLCIIDNPPETTESCIDEYEVSDGAITEVDASAVGDLSSCFVKVDAPEDSSTDYSDSETDVVDSEAVAEPGLDGDVW